MLSSPLTPTGLQQAKVPITTLIQSLMANTATARPKEAVAQTVQPLNATTSQNGAALDLSDADLTTAPSSSVVQPVSPSPSQDGVIFDLSKAALATVQNAQASQSNLMPAAIPKVAVAAANSEARLTRPAPQADKPAAVLAKLPAEADLNEEAGARAHALNAMEKAAIQSIIDNIKASAKAEIAADDRAEVARAGFATTPDAPAGP